MQTSLPSGFDATSHLSDLAKAYELSPLKVLLKYVQMNPQISNMAGGMSN